MVKKDDNDITVKTTDVSIDKKKHQITLTRQVLHKGEVEMAKPIVNDDGSITIPGQIALPGTHSETTIDFQNDDFKDDFAD